MKSAVVVGWGAVEQTAASWNPLATVREIEPRLWVVEVDGSPIGVIGKPPWTPEEIARRAAALT